MESWDRPPPDIEVAAFFEQWLPEAFAKSGRRGPLEGPVVRASISGEGGGAWELFVHEDVLERERAGARAARRLGAPVDRRSARRRWARPIPICPSSSRRGGRRSICCSSIRATSRCCVRSRGASRSSSRASDGGAGPSTSAFGAAGVAAGRPRSVVRVDGATFDGLRTGAIPPMQPLFDGRLKIEGDRALAMQLLLLLGSRLARG